MARKDYHLLHLVGMRWCYVYVSTR
jgi:hypothetical protein